MLNTQFRQRVTLSFIHFDGQGNRAFAATCWLHATGIPKLIFIFFVYFVHLGIDKYT